MSYKNSSFTLARINSMDAYSSMLRIRIHSLLEYASIAPKKAFLGLLEYASIDFMKAEVT